MKITTELLESLNACQSGINLVASYPDKDPEAVIRRLVADGRWDWANWLLPRLMDYKGYVSYAAYAAELVLPIWEKKYPDDKRPRKAIEAVKRCIDDPSKKNKEAAAAASEVTNPVWAPAEAAWSVKAALEAAAAMWSAWATADEAWSARSAWSALSAPAEAALEAAAGEAAGEARAAAEAAGEKNKSKIIKNGLEILKLSKK